MEGNILRDEQGKVSTARVAFWVVLTYDLLAILVDTLLTPVSAGGLGLLGTLTTFITVWAAGPRMAQYMAPQIGGALGHLSRALVKHEDTRQQILARHAQMPEDFPGEAMVEAAEREESDA